MLTKFIPGAFILVTIITTVLSCTPARMVVYNLPTIKSYKAFKSRTIAASTNAYKFYEAANTEALGDKIKVNSSVLHPQAITLNKYLGHSPTRAFIIIRNDSIIYERYFKGYEKTSTVTSFSVAKSFLSTMLGIAIDKGYVKGVKQPICDFFPELDRKKLGGVTIEHLLRHTSGIAFKGAGYQFYCSDICQQYNTRLKLRWAPGIKFKYDNANSQTLGILLERVFKKPLDQILHDEIWEPCGMEMPITWSIDSKRGGQIKAFCCLNGAARDFAKLGRLYLNNGNWNGKQIVPKEWVQQSTTPDAELGGIRNEKYYWWIGPNAYGVYWAAGLYGQYIMVYPKKNVVIVRFCERNLQPVPELMGTFLEVLDQL